MNKAVLVLVGVLGISGLFYVQEKISEAKFMTQLIEVKAELEAKTTSSAITSEQQRDDYINSHRPFVFKVVNQAGDSGGTGFLVKAPSGRAYLMTNQHVCDVSDNEYVYITNDSFTLYAKKKAIYKSHDLCLVEWPGNAGLTVAPMVRNTQNIWIIGHPLLEPLATTKGQLAGELVINVFQGYGVPCTGEGFQELHKAARADAVIMPIKQLQMFNDFGGCIRSLAANPVTAKIHPGNSGSPVLNGSGQVIGVAFAGGARDYIIPLRYIQKFLEGK